MNQYPTTNFHDLNLDWLLEEMQKLRDEWEEWRAAHEPIESTDEEEAGNDGEIAVSGN